MDEQEYFKKSADGCADYEARQAAAGNWVIDVETYDNSFTYWGADTFEECCKIIDELSANNEYN